MENIKYLLFYALLIAIIVLGALAYPWLVIAPAALVLSIAYILVKGKGWRQVLGKNDMNGALVFIGVLFSQSILAAICYGVGYVIRLVIT